MVACERQPVDRRSDHVLNGLKSATDWACGNRMANRAGVAVRWRGDAGGFEHGKWEEAVTV